MAKVNKHSPLSVDDKDHKILKVLSRQGRYSYRQIAKATSMSVVTVLNRIKVLETSGVIKQYAAILDHEKLGYDVQVLIDIRVAKGKLFEVEKKIASDPHVYALYDNTGHFDATVIAKFKTRATMDRFLKKIQLYPFVERTETKLILNTVKEGGLQL